MNNIPKSLCPTSGNANPTAPKSRRQLSKPDNTGTGVNFYPVPSRTGLLLVYLFSKHSQIYNVVIPIEIMIVLLHVNYASLKCSLYEKGYDDNVQ